jgi:hypothetical protein
LVTVYRGQATLREEDVETVLNSLVFVKLSITNGVDGSEKISDFAKSLDIKVDLKVHIDLYEVEAVTLWGVLFDC